MTVHSAADGAPNTDWIFGFGSLITNPGFDYDATVQPACIRGYRRVFHQGSTDHRGVPEAPGRTVTLEECEGGVTWGAAFRLAGDAEQRRRTMQYLEWCAAPAPVLRLCSPVCAACAAASMPACRPSHCTPARLPLTHNSLAQA